MRKVLRIILYSLGSLLLLLVLVVVWLNTPWGQYYVRIKAEAFLRDKLKTEVHIGHLGYGLPKYIVLENVFVGDQQKDTLLQVRLLKADVAMLQLIHKDLDVQQLVLQGVHSHVYRNAGDTTFNFTYIINAFTGAPSTAKPKSKSSSSFKIEVDRVALDDIHARYDDNEGGAILAINLDHLDLRMKKLDIDAMLFQVRELNVAGLQGSFTQDTSYLPPPPKTNTKTQLQLVADKVHLERIGFKYDDNLNKLLFGIDLGDLVLQLKKFDLANDDIEIAKLAVSNTRGILTMGKQNKRPAVIDTIVKIDTTEGWRINATDIALDGVAFKMDNESAARQREGIDYQHLDIKGVAMMLHNFTFTGDSIGGDMQHFAVKEQSGIEVKELKTVFSYNPQGARLKNLYLLTPHTVLQNYLEVQYPSLAEMQKHMQTMQLRINVDNSVIGVQDVLVFAPQLRQQDLFRKYPRGQVRLDATIYGYLNNLNISRFYASGMNNTEVKMDGHLRGLPVAKDISYNMHIAALRSSRQDIEELVPAQYLAYVRVPDKLGVTGKVSGTTLDYNPDLYLISTDGNAYVQGSLHMSGGKNKEQYDLLVQTSKLNLGRILKQDSLIGDVSAAVTVSGTSFDPKTMNAKINGAIGAAMVKKYQYHDVLFTADMANQKGNLSMSVADTNLRVHVLGSMDISGKYAAVKADLLLDSIDLQALKLYTSELRARGMMRIDIAELNPDYPRGTFTWRQPVVTADGKRYYMDSMYIVSRPGADTGQNIYADLDAVHARITGKTPLTKIGPILTQRFNRRYAFPVHDTNSNSVFSSIAYTTPVKQKDTTTLPANYDLKITANVVDRAMLHGILPGLTSFDSIHIDAKLTPSTLTVNAYVPELEYGSNTIEKGMVKILGTDSSFTYKATVDRITTGTLALGYADLHGNFDKDSISAYLSVADSSNKERFALAANMQSLGDSQILQLKPGLKLNYDVWDVAQPNKIVVANGGLYVSNFAISNGTQSIKANSDAGNGAPLKIDIANFQLSDITSIVSASDTALLATGTLGGTLSIKNMTSNPEMEGDVQVLQLAVLGDTLGDIKALIDNKVAGALHTDMTLMGHGNDIKLQGSYYFQPTNGNDLDMQLSINALALRSFETMAQNQIRNSSGFVRGDLRVMGTPYSPIITGTLKTDNLKTNVAVINSDIKMKAEQITFAEHTVTFNNFTVLDSPSNKAVINGSIDISDITDIEMDLQVKADKWRAVHSTKKDNELFYGDLVVTTNLKINGSVSTPIVDGSLNVLKGTDFTVVTPESNPQLESNNGIVMFVNMKDTGRYNLLVPHKEVAQKKRKLSTGSDFNVNITVDKAAKFSLVIDQASGDFISMKGDATLNASISPSGTIGLTGNYDLHEGVYQLNYNFIKRKFLIKDGSSITFAGDPLKGTNLDVLAAYEATVPPYDLVERQVTDQTQLNFYKQRLPFDVDLHMKGSLMAPGLAFDVTLPENKVYPLSSDQIELIQGKLNQIRTDTSELNKQVFALLILNRFVSDDPFNSAASSSVGFTALQSVSTFVGEQLNQAAGHFVKGVDFSVDLASTEDYTTGDMRQRTDLNLAASKRLLNDRLKLTVGNDFELEGPQTANQQNSYVPSNLAADYQLSADDKYTVRGYRRAYDEGVLQGYVTETGVNFIVSLDYNHFKNVLKRKKVKEVTDSVTAK